MKHDNYSHKKQMGPLWAFSNYPKGSGREVVVMEAPTQSYTNEYEHIHIRERCPFVIKGVFYKIHVYVRILHVYTHASTCVLYSRLVIP